MSSRLTRLCEMHLMRTCPTSAKLSFPPTHLIWTAIAAPKVQFAGQRFSISALLI